MKNVQHGNSRGVARTPRISKMESFAAIFNGFLIVIAKPFILDVCGGSGYT